MNKRPSSAHLDALSRSAGALAAHHLDSSTIESFLTDRLKASLKAYLFSHCPGDGRGAFYGQAQAFKSRTTWLNV